MALISCVECGKEISDRAKACPHCGVPLTDDAAIEPTSEVEEEEVEAEPIYCPNCRSKGKMAYATERYEKEVPKGSRILAWVLIVFGAPAVFVFVGIVLVAGGVLILQYGKKDAHFLYCETCKVKSYL